MARNPQGFPEPTTAVANRSDATPRRPDANVASVRDFTERSRRALENTKRLEEERKAMRSTRRERQQYLNKTMFYLDLKLAEDEQSLIQLFTDTAKKQLEGDIKLDKEKVKKEVLNRKNLLKKKKADIWTKDIAVAYGKLLTAIDPRTARIANLASMGGRRKTKRKKTRKTRKRRRIGKNKKQLKRLKTQYRRFRIAKGDKRFKGTKGLVKWSSPSKAKRKGKRRSRRIYHRKRR